MCRRVFPIISFNSKLLDQSCAILGALLSLGRRFLETWGAGERLHRPVEIAAGWRTGHLLHYEIC